NRVEIEQPAVDDAEEDSAIDALVGGQRRRVERHQARSEGTQPRDLLCDRGGREILEHAIVRVDAVAGGNRWIARGELVEVFVHQRSEGWRVPGSRRRPRRTVAAGADP